MKKNPDSDTPTGIVKQSLAADLSCRMAFKKVKHMQKWLCCCREEEVIQEESQEV